jgi:HD-GYP domain-containing protein (c-di-GMP phosphodiesterase class II)
MHIHEICGSWMEHPFWKKSFKLTRQADLDSLANCGVAELWIDSSKGLDIDASVEAVSAESGTIQVETALRQIADHGSEPEAQPRTTLREELFRARKVHAKAKQAVIAMFSEARMGNAIKVEQAATLVEEINQSITRNSDALLSLVRLKTADNYTYLHSVAVCALMIALGRQLELDESLTKELGVAGLLHDVGKMFVPSRVLNKPGRLTDAEFASMREHPRLGWALLTQSEAIGAVALDVCLHHHERVDGKGYPEGLSGDALTLHARMGAVCDVYDAITSTRCYKPGWEPAESIRKMAEWKDGHFDERIFQAFVKTVGIYPSGTLVRLKSGRLAVVVEQGPGGLLSPVVKVFFSARSKSPIRPELVDLANSSDAIANLEDPGKWGLDISKLAEL